MKTLPQRNVTFRAEDGHRLTVEYDTRGEPYRTGVTLEIYADMKYQAHLFLEADEVERLRDLLNVHYPVKP